jgi:hypothetical protein
MSTSQVPSYIPASYTTQNNTSSSTRTADNELGKDEFLKILAEQLANQDPLSPMSDTDFIAQMAQFSALEQMQELNATFASSQAYSMIGKNVLASVTDDSGNKVPIYGEVTGIVRQNNTDYLHIGQYLVPASSVSAVYDDNAMDGIISQGANLVGKIIEAEIPSEDGTSDPTKVAGKVDSVVVKDGLLYAVVGEKEVQVGYITKISNNVDDGSATEEAV